MNTSALKSFAPAVRRQLMEAVERKLDVVLAAQSPDYLATYARQVAALRALAQADRAGLVERVAYTWFNRLAALRYLDARGWHPFRTRVLTAAGEDETQPELLRVVRTAGVPEELQRYTNPARLNDLLDGRIPSSDPQGEVYRHLVLAACRFYHSLLPDLFERLDDETELLLPDDLLTEQSVVHGFRTRISDADCAEVEILGWLYQFYISEKKDAVMARKSAVPTEDIPAVTQLFTPHWIVRYLVENSLGRLWLLNRPASRLREQMPYYIEGEPETEFLRIATPEEIRVLDPAVGSGHMLTYAFDLLYAIYEEEGYAPSEIAGLILKHNLYGIDIDPRAAQLASLALVLKARHRSRRFFQFGVLVQPHVIALQDVRFDVGELREYVRALDLGELFNQPVMDLLGQFEEATTFGSLTQPVLRDTNIEQLRRTIEAKELGSELFLTETHVKVLRVLEQAAYLTQRYQAVVANPPYMGLRAMGQPLKGFLEAQYTRAKYDLYTAFISRSSAACQKGGYVAMVTMQGWLFLSSFTDFRAEVFRRSSFVSLIQLGPRAFNTISGEVVQTTAFVLRTGPLPDFPATYLDATAGRNEAEKAELVLRPATRFRVTLRDLERVESTPVAYWLSPQARKAFASGLAIRDVAKPRQGLATSDNGRFLRYWPEIAISRIGLGITSRAAAKNSRRKWFPLVKGGSARKWYGNNDYVVNWENDGQEMIALAADLYGSPTRTIKNMEFYFREGITWSTIATRFAMRFSPAGAISETKGAMCFSENRDDLLYLLGFANTRLVESFLKVFSPTLDFHEGPFGRLPFARSSSAGRVKEIVERCIQISRADWDNFESSWDFSDQPLLRPGVKRSALAESWAAWKDRCDTAIGQLQELETENNRIFIEAYGLQEELSPDVPQEQITLARADARRDVVAFLSYAIGCMMGRYSLNAPGLILADPGDSLENYCAKVGKPLEQLSFVPDEDGIVPVLDGEWFEDDVVARTRDFLRATFGEATLRENLRFIEESLGKDLRKYFLTDFYKDHLQTYKKRPIFWMVQSPKKGFSVLVYMHRYTRDTMNRVLNRYLRDYQVKLRNRLEQLAVVQASATASARDKTAARKEADKLTRVLTECQEWERQTVLPLAQARIELDLDDGVKVNYLKLGEALAPIPGLAAKDDE